MNLLQQIQDEADLCRNDGANDIADLLDEAAKAVKSLAELRDAVKRTVNLDDCGHADGVSLILVDAVKNADEVLNASAPRSNARADLPRIEDANRESGCEGNNRG